MTDARIRIDLAALLTVIATIGHGEVNREDLIRLTGLSRATLARHLASARRLLAMQIDYLPAPDMRGGHYVITDWGYLDRKNILRDYNPGA